MYYHTFSIAYEMISSTIMCNRCEFRMVGGWRAMNSSVCLLIRYQFFILACVVFRFYLAAMLILHLSLFNFVCFLKGCV